MDPSNWKTGPDCGGANYTFKLNWSAIDVNEFQYNITDQTGTEKFSGPIYISANACQNIELN